MNFTTGSSEDELLSLDNIRSTLIRLEDTIIFALIERSQFAWNQKIYEKGAFEELKVLGFEGSWLGWFLFETESFHAKARRYTSPDEHPFTPIQKLPQPIIAMQSFPSLLHPQSAAHPSTNANSRILDFYVNKIVLAITKRVKISKGSTDRDDGNYGSSATRDVEVLQALSRRIHFGMFVSESKFRGAPHKFIPHILAQPPNTEALAGLITKPAVEAALLVRLGNKAEIYGQELDPQGKLRKSPGEATESGSSGHAETRLDTAEVVALYRDWVIPLTKDVEVGKLAQCHI
ncbi:hypothetical protein QFC22_003396 [Naganishia vaughanmartiniae]|uniref:Uncharacterized protein n=1 Tax=Naganishia vaughanmartiniae TaxID=1424756 RepID=A0ACC2X8C9_9TREE|nr:hypothetical protein QFC22_003396 [Naganishia vaughanmartiniae]